MSSLRKGLLAVAALGAISLGTLALAALLPSAATAADGKPIVTLGKGAELYARGAAVNVGVHITCSPPVVPPGLSLSKNVSVQLSEVVAGDIVQQGYGYGSEFICDGSPHTSSVYVVPGGGGPFGGTAAHPFVNGTAFASATLSICTSPGIFPSPLPFASPTPMPPPSPGPGLPSCQTAQNVAVVTILGDFEG